MSYFDTDCKDNLQVGPEAMLTVKKGIEKERQGKFVCYDLEDNRLVFDSDPARLTRVVVRMNEMCTGETNPTVLVRYMSDNGEVDKKEVIIKKIGKRFRVPLPPQDSECITKIIIRVKCDLVDESPSDICVKILGCECEGELVFQTVRLDITRLK